MEDLPTYQYLIRSFGPQLILKQHWLSSRARLKLSCTSCTLKGFCIPLHEEARKKATASHPFPTSHGEKGDIPPQQPQTMGRAPERTAVGPSQPAIRLKTRFVPYGCIQNMSRSKKKTAKSNTCNASGLYCCSRVTVTWLKHSNIISGL